jgi:hypothetical protein
MDLSFVKRKYRTGSVRGLAESVGNPIFIRAGPAISGVDRAGQARRTCLTRSMKPEQSGGIPIGAEVCPTR